MRFAAALLVLLVVAAGCSSEPTGDEIEGRVTSATGFTLLEVFVITDDSGRSTQLTPSPDFGYSLSEMRDLVISGERVFVSYEVATGGERIALSLEEEWRR